jgi:hypothetical protein
VNGNTSTAVQTVTVTNTLPALGEIIGTDTACVAYAAGSTTFSVAPVSDGINPTTYTWTVPTGMTIVSGQGTNSITVSWTSISREVVGMAVRGRARRSSEQLRLPEYRTGVFEVQGDFVKFFTKWFPLRYVTKPGADCTRFPPGSPPF